MGMTALEAPGREAPERIFDFADASTEQLFTRCMRGDGRAREALITRFLPLARKLARRYADSSVPGEDLMQVASLALVKAVDRFDADRGRVFEAFAIPTILGELRRFFRDTTWSVHVARGAQERCQAVQAATERLSREHGRPPTVQQLAVYLELGEEEVLDGLQVGQAYAAKSLDAPAQDGDEDSDVTLGSGLASEERGYELVENHSLLADATEALSDREQRLLEMRFVGEMTQSQIAERLGVSQMQVSRLLRAALRKLRERVGALVEV